VNAAVERELRDIRNMPYGVARISAAEAVSRRIEAEGPREKLAEALLDLVEAYTFSDEGAKAFVVFARLLRLWDESPELFDEGDERNLFWEFKWIAGDLPDYPQITLSQAESLLSDMQRRFELAGHGLSSVRMSRFRWLWHTGRPAAETARIEWITGLRDEFEDCRACTIGQQVDYLSESGRHAEAVELALTQDASCNLEPARTRYALALSALLVGDPVLAQTSLMEAVASDDGDTSDFAPARGQGFEMLALGGQLEQALRRLRNDYPGLLRRASTPLFRLRFLLGVLSGLSANSDRGELTTGLHEPEWRTVRELHGWVHAEAAALASQFDARNGNAHYSERVSRALAAKRAPLPLPTTAVPSTPGGASVEPVPAAAPADRRAERPATGPATAVELFQRAEAIAAERDYHGAGAAYLEAARASEAEGLIAEAGLAYAEAAQCSSVSDDDASAHERFGLAVPRLIAGEADPEVRVAVLAAWAPIAARMADSGAQITATAAELDGCAEFDGTELSDELAERRRHDWRGRRATLRDTLARSIAAADPTDLVGELEALGSERASAEALTAAEEFAAIGRISDAAHAFWLAGRVQRDSGDVAASLWSLESAFEGFTVARQQAERTRVAGELIELLRDTGQPDRADEITAQLTS